MDTNKDEFNIPSVIVDPRTKTQYSKGRFLGKVCLVEEGSDRMLLLLIGWFCEML